MPLRCAHFGSCGGCQIQDLAYDFQLKLKQERLQSLLETCGWNAPIPIHPSPEIWFYRNKMEFAFGSAPGEGTPQLRLGFKRRGRWNSLLDIQECLLLAPDAWHLLETVRSWAREENLPPYDPRGHTGFLRYLVVREGKNTGQRMIHLLTAPGQLPAKRLLKKLSGVSHTTLLWGTSSKVSDVALAEEIRVLSGPGFIEEKLSAGTREITYRVSPHTFFQTNTRATEILYRSLREKILQIRPRCAWDLYCGSGGIAFSMADAVPEVVAVEFNPVSVEDAKQNAFKNGIGNVMFVCSKTEDFLAQMKPADREACLILDPPRSGLHPKAAAELLRLKAAHLFYVSCNPRALAADLKALGQCYKIGSIEAFDLFPHTEHVELVVHLCLS